jgi:hypothetical protein
MMRPGFLGFGYVHPVLGDFAGRGKKKKTHRGVPERIPAKRSSIPYTRSRARTAAKPTKRTRRGIPSRPPVTRTPPATPPATPPTTPPGNPQRADFVAKRAAFVTALAQARSIARSGNWRRLAGPLARLRREDAALTTHPGRSTGPRGNSGGAMPHLPSTRGMTSQAALSAFSRYLTSIGPSRATRNRDPFSPGYYS